MGHPPRAAQCHQKPSGEQHRSSGLTCHLLDTQGRWVWAQPHCAGLDSYLRGATLLLWMQTMYYNCFPRFSPNQLQKGKAHLEIRSGPHRNIQGFWTKIIICVCTHTWTPLRYGKNTKGWGGGFSSLSPRWLKTTWRHPQNVSWMLRYAAGPMASGASHQPELPGQLPLPASCAHIPPGNVVLDILPVFYVKGLLLSLICDAKAWWWPASALQAAFTAAMEKQAWDAEYFDNCIHFPNHQSPSKTTALGNDSSFFPFYLNTCTLQCTWRHFYYIGQVLTCTSTYISIKVRALQTSKMTH